MIFFGEPKVVIWVQFVLFVNKPKVVVEIERKFGSQADFFGVLWWRGEGNKGTHLHTYSLAHGDCLWNATLNPQHSIKLRIKLASVLWEKDKK